jgi:hypothetical protein
MTGRFNDRFREDKLRERFETYDSHGAVGDERPSAHAFYIATGDTFNGDQRLNMDNENV